MENETSTLPVRRKYTSLIIAIDPGPESSAVVVWDGTRPHLYEEMINFDLLEWVRHDAPNVEMAVEMIACYGMPVGAETFETCLLIGRLQEIWITQGNPFQLVYRKDVKMHICGTMKAKDGNIRQALIDKLGVVGTKKNPGPLYGISNHLWSALAVAVTAQETNI